MVSRQVAWRGFLNARDLGGLPTVDGRSTRHWAVIRCAEPSFVRRAGWRAARDAGIRTIVDLQDAGETALLQLPAGLNRVDVPLEEGLTDDPYWREIVTTGAFATPLYYRSFIDRWPERCAAAVAAVARAEPGGVIIHCALGRDRTGLVTLLLLALAGVEPAAIADDYCQSSEVLRSWFGVTGDQVAAAGARLLADRGTTAHAAVLAALDRLDLESALRSAGLASRDVTALRSRLLA